MAAVSLNSFVGFNSTVSSSYVGAKAPKSVNFTSPLGLSSSKRLVQRRKSGLCHSIADSDRIANNESSSAESPLIDDSQTSNSTNGSVSSDTKPVTAKRTPLTARERLRAARVLSRYIESKPSKPDIGSKVLDALRESDGPKKRSTLPEAPTNMFDDSDRGLPKQGLTFQIPGGADLLVIAFSFVFISTVMFATTYIVWKVGAIHFNEF